MKTKSIFFLPIFAAGAFALFSNCSGSKKESTDHDEHKEQDTLADATGSAAAAAEPEFGVDPAFQQQLAGVFTAYVGLKDAFVASDVKKVKNEAAAVKAAIASTDMKLLTGAAHNPWMNYLEGIDTSLKQIEAATDIEIQREAFSKLSENMYKSIKAYGLGGATAYYEFCPMAFNNEGGYWLSSEEKIRNPYFGDEMLTCGEVKEKLK